MGEQGSVWGSKGVSEVAMRGVYSVNGNRESILYKYTLVKHKLKIVTSEIAWHIPVSLMLLFIAFITLPIFP